MGRKVAVVTMERHFDLVDETGHVEWQAILPDDVCQVACDPLGHSVILGFQQGGIARLDCPAAR
jgi:hypothetical protein